MYNCGGDPRRSKSDPLRPNLTRVGGAATLPWDDRDQGPAGVCLRDPIMNLDCYPFRRDHRRRPGLLPACHAAALTCLLAVVALGWPTLAAAQVVHEERSFYRNILVRDQGGVRCLLFSERRSSSRQTCMNLRDPDRIVLSYVRMMFAGLLLVPEPRRILLIGLGGGTLPKVFETLYPDAHQDLIEIDPAVVRVAERFFDFRPSANMHVHVRDARVFVKRALPSATAAATSTW